MDLFVDWLVVTSISLIDCLDRLITGSWLIDQLVASSKIDC